MYFLFPLTPWNESVVSRGKYVGNKSRDRKVLCIDSWNWVFALQRNNEETAPVGFGFAGNTRLLCSCLKQYDIPIDPYDFLENLFVPFLAKRTGKGILKIDRSIDIKSLGKSIDDYYGSSFMREPIPQVRKRLGFLGSDGEEAPTEVEAEQETV